MAPMGEYQPIPLDDEKQSDASAWGRRIRHLDDFYHHQAQTAGRLCQHWVWLVHVALLSVSTTLFALAFCLHYGGSSGLVAPPQSSIYSPAAPIVRYENVRYNLTPNMNWSPYVGKGPEVDEAWEQISRVGDMMISREEVERLGMPLDSLKVTDPKTGKVGYRAAIEVFHQLHCLNLLRQFTWKDYYVNEGGDISADPEDVRGHVDHCLETLRMNLMCQADVGVFTFRVYPELGDDDPWPDFSTMHTCRNFDEIRDWARSRAVTWDDNA